MKAADQLTRHAEEVAGTMIDRGHRLDEWREAGSNSLRVNCRRDGCGAEVTVHADGEVEGDAYRRECEG